MLIPVLFLPLSRTPQPNHSSLWAVVWWPKHLSIGLVVSVSVWIPSTWWSPRRAFLEFTSLWFGVEQLVTHGRKKPSVQVPTWWQQLSAGLWERSDPLDSWQRRQETERVLVLEVWLQCAGEGRRRARSSGVPSNGQCLCAEGRPVCLFHRLGKWECFVQVKTNTYSTNRCFLYKLTFYILTLLPHFTNLSHIQFHLNLNIFDQKRGRAN